MVSMEMVNGIATTPKLLLSSASTMVGTVSIDNGNTDIDELMILVMVFDDSILSIDWIRRLLLFITVVVMSLDLTICLDEKKKLYETDKTHRMHTSNNCSFIFWVNSVT